MSTAALVFTACFPLLCIRRLASVLCAGVCVSKAESSFNPMGVRGREGGEGGEGKAKHTNTAR